MVRQCDGLLCDDCSAGIDVIARMLWLLPTVDAEDCGCVVLCTVCTADDGLGCKYPLLCLFLQEHQLVDLRVVRLYWNNSWDGVPGEDVVGVYRSVFSADGSVLLVSVEDHGKDYPYFYEQETLAALATDNSGFSGTLSVRHS